MFGKLRSGFKSSCHIWAVAYVFFNAFPHFDAVTHSHSSEGSFHSHGFTSSHDVALERTAFVALANGGSDLVLPSSQPEADEPPQLPLEPGLQGIRSSGLLYHSHFQEDPNLAALGVSVAFALILLGLLHLLKLLPIPFLARRLLNPSARGPPALLLSI